MNIYPIHHIKKILNISSKIIVFVSFLTIMKKNKSNHNTTNNVSNKVLPLFIQKILWK